jgi:hypothetical protein
MDYNMNKEQLKKIIKEELVSILKPKLNEGFWRLPTKTGHDKLYRLKDSVDYLEGRISSGNDYDPNVMKTIEALVKDVKKLAKKFNKKEDLTGTDYE